MLVPVALDLVSAPASQAYVKHVFSVCNNTYAGKHINEHQGVSE